MSCRTHAFIHFHCSNQSWCRPSCFRCGEAGIGGGDLQKCSMGMCGRHYHARCAAGCPLTRHSVGGAFRCPVHYCCHCGLSGDSIPMVQCILCPVGYHVRYSVGSEKSCPQRILSYSICKTLGTATRYLVVQCEWWFSFSSFMIHP